MATRLSQLGAKERATGVEVAETGGGVVKFDIVQGLFGGAGV